MAKHFGVVEEISYIPVDKKGKPSCFIIFEEQGIDKRLINLKVELRTGIFGVLGTAYSPLELKSHSTFKSSSKKSKSVSRKSSSGSLSDGFRHKNFRFNMGVGKGFSWVQGILRATNPVGFKMKFKETR